MTYEDKEDFEELIKLLVKEFEIWTSGRDDIEWIIANQGMNWLTNKLSSAAGVPIDRDNDGDWVANWHDHHGVSIKDAGKKLTAFINQLAIPMGYKFTFKAVPYYQYKIYKNDTLNVLSPDDLEVLDV